MGGGQFFKQYKYKPKTFKMTKEELEKLQKDPLWKAHKIVGRDANGKLVMEEITAKECAEATHENFVYKQPDNNDCAVKPLGAERTSKKGLIPNPNARYDSRYPGGFAPDELDANISAFLYGEKPAPAPEPKPLPNPLKNFDFGKDMPKELLQRAGWNDGVVGKKPEQGHKPAATTAAKVLEPKEAEEEQPTKFRINRKQHTRWGLQVQLAVYDTIVVANIPNEKKEAVGNADILRTTREGSNMILSYFDTNAICTGLKPEHILNK